MSVERIAIQGIKDYNGRLSAEDFKKIQAALGLTNNEIANELCMSKQIVSNMRNGHRKVARWTQRLLAYIADDYGFTF